jgi:hypothetical protein
VVNNRSDTDIADFHVRYYWAGPHTGFAPSNWKLIPATAGHNNPTNAFQCLHTQVFTLHMWSGTQQQKQILNVLLFKLH